MAAGALTGVTDGKGIGFAIKTMKASAGLSSEETRATALAVLIPSALLLLADSIPRDAVHFPGAAAVVVGNVVAAGPATVLAAHLPAGLAASAFGTCMLVGGAAQLASAAPQLKRSCEAAFALSPRAGSTSQTAPLVATSVVLSLATYGEQTARHIASTCAAALAGTSRIPERVVEQCRQQYAEVTSDELARYALSGALGRTVSAVFGPSVGLFLAPVPLLTSLTGITERTALATFCVGILPKGLGVLLYNMLRGHTPRPLSAFPFAVGLMGASTVGGYVALMSPPEYIAAATGLLLCAAGGTKAAAGIRVVLAAARSR